MDTLEQILDALSKLLPGSIALKAGPLAATFLVLLFTIFTLWQAITKGVSDAISAWLKEHSRSFILIILVLPILGAIAAGALYTAALMTLLAGVAGLLHCYGRLPASLRALAVTQFCILLAATLIEHQIKTKKENERNKNQNVYAVLPLQPYQGEDLNTLLSLSKTLRDTIGMAFQSLKEDGRPKVHIVPGGYSAVEDLNSWMEINTAVERLNAEGLPPDVVLVNQALLMRTEGEFVTLLLQLNVHSPGEEEPFRELKNIVQTGQQKHFPYLALRASLAIVDELRNTSLALTKAEEDIVAKDVLARYSRYLIVSGAPVDFRQEIDKVLRGKSEYKLSYNLVREAVNFYPKDERREIEKALDRKTVFFLSKAGAPPSVPDVPAEEEHPPVLRISEPATPANGGAL